jgi:hypothetical protein
MSAKPHRFPEGEGVSHVLKLLDEARRHREKPPGKSPATPTAPGLLPKEPPRRSLPDGAQLGGKLRILGLLDTGGMGEVYVAWHAELGCEVAVKVLPEDLAQQRDHVARFRRSIQTQARTSGHEHIVATMDAGQEQGRPYLVMEYVPGTNLKNHVVQQGPLPWPEACRYIRQAAEGLRHAHSQGIVHRDIKPANLLLTPEGKVKVLDWGLARLHDQEALTHSSVWMGTPNYVAPEQAQYPNWVDPRSDLYSLGCTFYYLLVGHPPATDGARNEGLVCKALRNQRPDVPAAVVHVVAKLLAPQPEDRYASAQDLLGALDAPTRSSKRKWAVLGGAVLVLLALGKWVLMPTSLQPAPLVEVAASPADTARKEPPPRAEKQGQPPRAAATPDSPALRPTAMLSEAKQNELNDATVLVCVDDANHLFATGIFIRKVDETTGYFVCNRHALLPTEIALPTLGARAVALLASSPGIGCLLAAAATMPVSSDESMVLVPQTDVQVIVRKGTAKEQMVPATVVAIEGDLAVLKATRAKDLPKRVYSSPKPQLAAKMPVWVLGTSAGITPVSGQSTPAITARRFSVAALTRGEQDDVVALHLDGALDSNHSVGPVVDADGHLVGVAATTRTMASVRLLHPSVTGYRLGTKKRQDNTLRVKWEQGQFHPSGAVRIDHAYEQNTNHNIRFTDQDVIDVEVEISLHDALESVQTVVFHYERADHSHRQENLSLASHKAQGMFQIQVPPEGERLLWWIAYGNEEDGWLTTNRYGYLAISPFAEGGWHVFPSRYPFGPGVRPWPPTYPPRMRPPYGP